MVDHPPDETQSPRPRDESAGYSVIGPYRLLEIIGEGGMGVVYLAEQARPIHRRVALKIVKAGMDTRRVIARFETEREALALMNHPHIARVFDAGSTEQGRPYFVMEYVAGVAITEYCDRNRLDTDQRLELFLPVCEAIQHAHQKGIIHRDVKPSNVLVAMQDGRPVPKVIDFGVAKATQHHLTEGTFFTEQGQLIGTPGYMSPEQADLTALDIDTRTDIYSLGVLLYELLVGSLPFDARELRRAGFAEIQRIIREVDPPKPSTRLSRLGRESTVVARNRRTEPRSLARELRGDLDWITVKCLEKDRTRRYDSASALASDLRRHQRHEPVAAGPPTRRYRLGKFIRRNKLAVGAASAIGLALITGLAATTVQYVRAERERLRADHEAVAATRVKEFLVELFHVSDPSEALGNTVTAREILDRGARRIRDELRDQPLVQANLMHTMGTVYANLGLFDSAKELLDEALAIRRAQLPAVHADVAASLFGVAQVIDAKGHYAEAEKLLRESLAMYEALVGREHVVTVNVLSELSGVLVKLGRMAEAESLRLETLAIRRKLLGPDHPDVALSLVELARITHARGDLNGAERLYRQGLDIRMRVLGPIHPQLAESTHYLAGVLYPLGRHEEAERLYRDALTMYRTLYGDDDVRVAGCQNNLAVLLAFQKRYEEAEALARSALDVNRRRLGPEHAQIASDLNTIGVILRGKGEYLEAERLHRESLAMRLKLFGPDNEYVGVSRMSLGTCLALMGRHDQAEAEMLEAVRVFRTGLGDSHHRTRDALRKIADLYRDLDRPDEESRYRALLPADNNPP